MVALIKSYGKIPAIFSSVTNWQKIFGSRYACTGFKDLELWYPHSEESQSFNDFVEFGGWKKPSMKQYHVRASLCESVASLNYRP